MSDANTVVFFANKILSHGFYLQLYHNIFLSMEVSFTFLFYFMNCEFVKYVLKQESQPKVMRNL